MTRSILISNHKDNNQEITCSIVISNHKNINHEITSSIVISNHKNINHEITSSIVITLGKVECSKHGCANTKFADVSKKCFSESIFCRNLAH